MKREKYAVFTIDVEDFADTECVAKSGQRVRRHMLDGLDIYIRLLEQYQIRATMFAVCRTALREQERVQRYVDRGHRLALHGLEHVPPCGMDDEHFRRATLAGKQQLETAFHTQVSGYRAPCFGMDEKKLDIVRQLGFRYDSSPDGLPGRAPCEASGHDELPRAAPRHLPQGRVLRVQPVVPAFARAELSDLRRAAMCAWAAGTSSCRFCAAICAKMISMCFICIRLSFRGSGQPELEDLKLYDRYYLHRGLLTYRRKVEAIHQSAPYTRLSICHVRRAC